MPIKQKTYYLIKPLIPRSVQIAARRMVVGRKLKNFSGVWPIHPDSAAKPCGWPGWPNGKKFAFILTHDVDTFRGHERVRRLAEAEKAMGFKSSFYFVAKRYPVSDHILRFLVKNGFEIGVHGLYHDGKKFNSFEIFNNRAILINEYLSKWEAVGYRSPSMHHNLEWIGHLNIEYDASTFDTDPFEPQSDGTGTIFPFMVPGENGRPGFMELPYTLPQDFTLFIMMRKKNSDIWKRKLDWIANNGGMALINTHPDYMKFNGGKLKVDEYPAELYLQFLDYVKDQYGEEYCHLTPRDLTAYLRQEWNVPAEETPVGNQTP